ncbi:MAG TPA: deoxyribodipyrimidine photo-lyase [Myxococcales bacterium]
MNELLTVLLQNRVCALNDRPVRAAGEFVLLWLHGQRRIRNNLAFAHAQRAANELGRPLIVYEGLRNDYPYASARFHQFILEGVADTAADCEAQGVSYAFFLQTAGAPRGVLHRLAARAALVVSDWLPHFVHPAQSDALAARAPCRVEAVDAAGVAPLAAFARAEIAARTLRPKLHKLLPDLLQPIPRVPARIGGLRRFDWGFDPWTGAPGAGVRASGVSCEVPPAGVRGGRAAGLRRMHEFLRRGLPGYSEGRNDPAADRTSGLSPWLHFGHLGAAEIALAAQESGAPPADLDAFLEQLLVRRELAYNAIAHQARLPPWAVRTLREHESDPRPALPSDGELESARTPSPLWNAMQTQLVREGRIHGWLRMLWGKTLLLWSRDAGEALRRMAWLNDKYALDGRDAVSSASFLWCLGLHDRPFPERPVFGTVRSMSLSSAEKKQDLTAYLRKFAVDTR